MIGDGEATRAGANSLAGSHRKHSCRGNEMVRQGYNLRQMANPVKVGPVWLSALLVKSSILEVPSSVVSTLGVAKAMT